MRNTIICSDALEFLRKLSENSVHVCITSPPYFGLRDYGVDGQIGMESTPEEYVKKITAVFHETRRVLHPSGTCWVVIGDSYNGSGGAGGDYGSGGMKEGRRKYPGRNVRSLKPKDMIGIPWMLAFALRSDGWWLRQCVVWEKPNALPGSQIDRPTTDYEFIFLLAKSERYFYDYSAVIEPHTSLFYDGRERQRVVNFENSKAVAMGKEWGGLRYPPEGRRLRSIWRIPVEGFSARKYGLDVEHYAVFPQSLAERCIRLSTSEAGVCGKCGAPWVRIMEKENMGCADCTYRSLYNEGSGHGSDKNFLSKVVAHCTIGWKPSCTCGAPPGIRPDDMEIIETPTGKRIEDDPTLKTGRAGFNRPRGTNEGSRPMTRYEQRMYAKQLRNSPCREQMETEVGSAFAHYIRTDRGGARPLPHELLEKWIENGRLEKVDIPAWEFPSPVPALVLDPFCGSGTTLAAAKKLGRDYIGCDLNPDYVRLAKTRVNRENAQFSFGF